jgi:hypothetical protein
LVKCDKYTTPVQHINKPNESVLDKYNMSENLPANEFFNDVDFVSIVNNLKGILTSDGSMSVLLDFERVLDSIDLYACKNWLIGELVDGPEIGRYSVTCTFMWPYKLMPDPRGAKRILAIDGSCHFMCKEVEIPIQVKNYDDFVPGTNYPKMVKTKVWLVKIKLPMRLLEDIKQGSMDLADQEIDLQELQDSYKEDMDKTSKGDESNSENAAIDNAALGNLPAAAPTEPMAPPV